MKKHILLTNDFPPKIGGIQSYLWELWKRLPPESFVVITPDQLGANEFDAQSGMNIIRYNSSILLPTSKVIDLVESVAKQINAEMVIVDPVLPLGLIGKKLTLPYSLILHGAELGVPAHLPVVKNLLSKVLLSADQIIASGNYPFREAKEVIQSSENIHVIPPGVDIDRFRPLSRQEIIQARQLWGLKEDDLVLASLSRLVPRKGMDVLLDAASILSKQRPNLKVLIGGKGRQSQALAKQVSILGIDALLVGEVKEELLPSFYASCDVFAMLSRNRWLGLEQEGFGIVFLEAASSGVAVVGGNSGGSSDAIENMKTGFIVNTPSDPTKAAAVLSKLLDNQYLRNKISLEARKRVEEKYSYEFLVKQLYNVLTE